MQNPARSAGLLSDLVRNARVAWKLFRDPRVSKVTKLAIPGLAVAYLLLPIDLVPDFLPGLGQLDDLALIALGIKMFIDLSPQWLVQFYRDQLAGKNPTNGGARGGNGKTVDGEYKVMD